jgi:cytochrome c biogenesis protein CcmG/thiol:disulfide interchange protein DsbE
LDGDESFQLSHYRGQGVVINFWASWCYPCRQEMSLLESSWRTYREQGVVFVGVDVWDTEADAKEFLQEFDVTYPTGLDTTSEIAKLYALQGVPTTLFIAPDGTINHIIFGLLNPESLTNAVAEIIPNREVE